jgi:hypothetical protein
MEKKQIPIWFFIGALVGVYGLIILSTGIVRLIRPPAVQLALGNLHSDIWWGGLLLVIGLVYTFKYWPGKRNG